MKNYVTPEVEYIALSRQDVIVTSGDPNKPADNETPWT